MTIAQTSPAAVPFAELEALTIGTVAVPGDKAYDALVSPWNLAVPVRPVAVLAAFDAQDVVEAVQFAARHGIRVTPQATGHGPTGPLVERRLQQAHHGRHGHDTRGEPPEQRPQRVVDRYFAVAGTDSWDIMGDLRESVRFTRANIVDPVETRPHGQFDVIFCRNVLIYFDDLARRTAAENLFECLYYCVGCVVV